MKFHILTLFPEMVLGGLGTSITGRAMEQNKIGIEAINIRDYTKDKHKKVDDYPYGGGAGMLMQAQPVYDAYCAVEHTIPKTNKRRVIYVTPQGTPFSQKIAQDLAQNDDLIFLCGHYEGIDERVLEEVVTDYISIGDYVLTGGELAAMVMIDAISRLVPGVLNNKQSAETESFHRDLLEYPQYSRPEVWHEKPVPKVLMSGNARKIEEWRLEQSVARTKERRPDLYEKYAQMEAIYELLRKDKLLHIDMLEGIKRGTAALVKREGGNVLLYNAQANIYYFTALDGKEAGEVFLSTLPDSVKNNITSLCTHQDYMNAFCEKAFDLETELTCYQMVYTQREQVAISDLYRNDGKEHENGIQIRMLTEENLAFVEANYRLIDKGDYLKERIAAGQMYGAFVKGELAGFVGLHDDGGIGMLEVMPSMRGRKIGKALEVFMINTVLSWGWTPYGQVVLGNEISLNLQRSIGLYPSKSPMYWLTSK